MMNLLQLGKGAEKPLLAKWTQGNRYTAQSVFKGFYGGRQLCTADEILGHYAQAGNSLGEFAVPTLYTELSESLVILKGEHKHLYNVAVLRREHREHPKKDLIWEDFDATGNTWSLEEAGTYIQELRQKTFVDVKLSELQYRTQTIRERTETYWKPEWNFQPFDLVRIVKKSQYDVIGRENILGIVSGGRDRVSSSYNGTENPSGLSLSFGPQAFGAGTTLYFDHEIELVKRDASLLDLLSDPDTMKACWS